MVRSMTGFGQASREAGGVKIQIDIRSVNHRYSEVVVRMPREWLSREEALKKTVQQEVKRGRVEMFVTMERSAVPQEQAAVNWLMLDAYVSAAEQIAKRYGMKQSLSLKDLLAVPELISLDQVVNGADETVAAQLIDCALEAVSKLSLMREAEGSRLLADVTARLSALEKLHQHMQDAAPRVAADYQHKLRGRITELLTDPGALDESRLMMEVALMADRASIDEELVRLDSHFHQSRALLSSEEPIGRKLDFLIQEMNREANTIGSKANDAELAGLVVEMKSELEKMREQVQNIE